MRRRRRATPPRRRGHGARAAVAPRGDHPRCCPVLGSARHQVFALLAAAATNDVRPGLATTVAAAFRFEGFDVGRHDGG